MTTRALVKDHPWSSEKARAGTMSLAVVAAGEVGRWHVELIPEPLVRRAEGGALQRSLRVVVTGDEAPSPVISVRSGGATVESQTVSGPDGAQRVYLPHVPDTRQIRVDVELGDQHGEFGFELLPAREWTLHLVHHSHLDIGYTDPQGLVLGEHVSYLDACLDLTRRTDDWPDDAKFRWAVESLWSFQQWAAARPAGRVAQFIERVKAGQIELTAMPYNLHTDACSVDELAELLRPAREVAQKYGVEFSAAMQTDVPGSVMGLPDALGQIGVRYLSVAHNWAGRSVPQLVGGQHLPRLFRWRGPSGHEVLVWMTDSPHGLAYMEGPVLGFDTSYEMVDDLLPAYLTSLSTRPYPFPPGMFGWHGPAVEDREPYPWDVLHLRVQGHFGDNAPPRLIMSETVRRWNETYAWPKLRLSTNHDFFAEAESRLADRLQTFTGDWGDWWVEGVGSAARPQAMVRQAQASVASARTLYGLACVEANSEDHAQLAAASSAESQGVYSSVSLFNEHTWGASNPWTHGDSGMDSGEQQWHWKVGHSIHGHDDAEVMLDHASAALGSRLPRGENGLTYWAVNPTALARSSTVSLFVPESRVPLERSVALTDGRTGKPVPFAERAQQNPTHRTAGRFLDATVSDVPPLGAVPLVVSEQDAPALSGVAGRAELDVGRNDVDRLRSGVSVTADPVLENAHLRVEVDLMHAWISSITEKASGRELVNQDAVVGLNGYVYDTYTTAAGFNHQANRTSVSEELELLGSRRLAGPAVLLAVESDDVEQRLVYEYHGDGMHWARTTLRLGHDSSVLVIENRYDKSATMTKESAYLSFPFAMDTPTVRYEITGGVTGTGLEHVPGAPQHMRAVRSWVTLSDDHGPVAWATPDAFLVQPETIALPYAPFPDSTAPREPGTVWSWLHNNLWDTNFPSQQAFTATFRYGVGVRRVGETIDAAALAVRTAAEFDQPLVSVPAEGPVGELAERSALRISDGRIRVVDMSPHPDGGLLVRLHSAADEQVMLSLDTDVPIVAAQTATYLGDTLDMLDIKASSVTLTVPAQGPAAVLLSFR